MPDLPEPLTDAELKELVRERMRDNYVDVEMVTDRDPQALSIVFMPLVLGGLDGYDYHQRGQLSAYGLMQWAGPMAMNGWPIFFKVKIILRDDALKIHEMYTVASKAVEDALS